MKADIKIWLIILYNGTTIIVDRFCLCNDQIQLFSNGAKGTKRGFGIYLNGKWAHSRWPKSLVQSAIMTDTTFLESFPVVMALSFRGTHLANTRI